MTPATPCFRVLTFNALQSEQDSENHFCMRFAHQYDIPPLFSSVLHFYIYVFSFSRRFYPKRLTIEDSLNLPLQSWISQLSHRFSGSVV